MSFNIFSVVADDCLHPLPLSDWERAPVEGRALPPLPEDLAGQDQRFWRALGEEGGILARQRGMLSPVGIAEELLELYWAGEVRDVPFRDFLFHPLCCSAAQELLDPGAQGNARGRLARCRLFRAGAWAGFDDRHPYLSLLLTHDVGSDGEIRPRRVRRARPGQDFAWGFGAWRRRQLGDPLPSAVAPLGDLGLIHTPRDLSALVGKEGVRRLLEGALRLLQAFEAPPAPGLPEARWPNAQALWTQGAPTLWIALQRALEQAEVTANAFAPAVRRLSPEEVGGILHRTLGLGEVCTLPAPLLRSHVLKRTYHRTGAYLLPLGALRGGPAQPCHPELRALRVGAGVTVMKAFLRGDTPVGEGVSGATGGLVGCVSGLLDRLAWNIGFSACLEGSAFRRDVEAGLLLGEWLAQDVLERLVSSGGSGPGFAFRGFTGGLIQVQAGRRPHQA